MPIAENLTWAVTRASGVVALVLLTASVLVGVLLSGRGAVPGWPRFAVESVHRFASLLAWTFTGIHVLVLLADGYLRFSVWEIVIPGLSEYRPLATAGGVVALELLAAVGIANRLRGRIGHRAWRTIHYAAFAVWALALAHGMAGGTDTGRGWAVLLYGLLSGLVAGALVWRIGVARHGGRAAERDARAIARAPGRSAA